MKTAIVPAQVTTVEDKIAGNLSLQQLVIIATPVFLGCLIYVALPPSFKAEPYKIVIMVAIGLVFGTMAIRIKGKLLLQWIAIFARYNTRPRYYVFNKNDAYLRDIEREATSKKAVKQLKPQQAVQSDEAAGQLDISAKARLEQIVTDPKAKLAFRRSKKGGLDVYITEIK